MKNFTRFASYFTDYVKAGRHHRDDFGVPGEVFIENMRRGILKCHVFEVNEDIKRMLVLTKTPKRNDIVRLPFKTIFIDVGFMKEEMAKLGMATRGKPIDIGYNEIVGIMVTQAILVRHPKSEEEYSKLLSNPKDITTAISPITEHELELIEDIDKKVITPDGKVATLTKETINEILTKYKYKVGTALRITICSVHPPEEGYEWFDEFTEDINIYDQYKDTKVDVKRIDQTDKKAKKFIHLFVLNFLNFLNSPEVQYVTVDRDENRNTKRLQKGKAPIPDRLIIKLTGRLKIYADELKKNPKWHYHYRFDVRGHFRTLRNARYGENVGRRIWIDDFEKGIGPKVNSLYRIGKDDTEEVEEVEDET